MGGGGVTSVKGSGNLHMCVRQPWSSMTHQRCREAPPQQNLPQSHVCLMTCNAQWLLQGQSVCNTVNVVLLGTAQPGLLVISYPPSEGGGEDSGWCCVAWPLIALSNHQHSVWES